MSLIDNDKPTITLHAGITRLTDRHRQIMAAMVHGLEPALAARYELEANRPLGVNEVADMLKVRRAYVRGLLADPLFKAEFATQLANKRMAYAPEAIDRIAAAMRNQDDNVGLRASVAMLGETAKAAGVNVSITNQNATFNNAADIKPGYVLVLPPDPDNEPNPSISPNP